MRRSSNGDGGGGGGEEDGNGSGHLLEPAPTLSVEGGAGNDGKEQQPARSLRPRKSALFYPSSSLAAQSNQKPFSSSAAKRESVLALGSIGHLQHLFSKQGIASRQRPQMAGQLTLAIGHAAESAMLLHHSPPSSPTLGPSDALAALNGDHPVLVLPPSPTPPQNKRLPYPDVQRPTDVDPEALLPDVIQALDDTCQQWDLIGLVKASHRAASASASDSGHASQRNSGIDDSIGNLATERRASLAGTDRTVDILELIKGTTRTIRRVRAYLLALPADVLAARLAERAGRALTQSETATLVPKAQEKRHAFRRMSSYAQLPRVEPRVGAGSSFGPDPVASTSSLSSMATSAPNGLPASISSSSSSTHSHSHASPIKRRPTRDASESDARSSNGHGGLGSTLDVSPTSSPAKGSAATTGSTASTALVDDPLAVIRKSALEVLGMLRALEESYRLPPDDPAYHNQAGGPNGRRASAAAWSLEPSASFVTDEGALGSPTKTRAFSSDVAATLSASSSRSSGLGDGSEADATVTAATRDAGPPGATSGTSTSAGINSIVDNDLAGAGQSGYLYRTDVRADALHDQRNTVRNYIDTVEYVLSTVMRDNSSDARRSSLAFGGGASMGRPRSRLGPGSEHGSSRASSALGYASTVGTGVVGPSADDMHSTAAREYVDSEDEDSFGIAMRWNSPGRMAGGIKQRLLMLMDDVLPPDLRGHLISKGTDASSILSSLADGHLVCIAYNAALRRSRRPWGFIRADDIHPLVGGGASTAEAARWTFRKTDNLRNWAAALRLRYAILPDDLAIVDLDLDWEEQSRSRLGAAEKDGTAVGKVRFEPRVVARQEAGWDVALAALLTAWLKALMSEDGATS